MLSGLGSLPLRKEFLRLMQRAVPPFIASLLEDTSASAARSTLELGDVATEDVVPVAKGGHGQATALAGFDALKQAATDTYAGVVEKATDAEAQAGTSTDVVITPANMKAAQIQVGTPVTLTNQTAVDFTGIAANIKRITIPFDAASLNGTSGFLVQLGDAGGIENTGYVALGALITTATVSVDNSTAGFPIRSSTATNALYGTMVIERSGTSNRWIATHTGYVNNASVVTGSGAKTLSDTLTQIRVTTINGTDQMDAGVLGGILLE